MKIAIMKLGEVLITALPLDLIDEDAMGFQTDLLHEINLRDAKGVVIDISALDIVDSFMARIINDSASMAVLLGVKVVVCGMQPQVATTLIEMGRELLGVEAALNLDLAMQRLLQRIDDE
ncbi:MAG: STAS domain-containing protein [Mariprofundus sp.]|nr:STAS domain-containing protein [Mariprofundus sp.]